MYKATELQKKKIVINCRWHFDSSILLLPFQVKSLYVCRNMLLLEFICMIDLSDWIIIPVIWLSQSIRWVHIFFMCSRKSVLFISKVKRVQQQRCHVGGGNNSCFLIMDLAAVYEAILVICCCLPVVLFFLLIWFSFCCFWSSWVSQ